MNLVILGPNLVDQSKGDMHVHSAGCRDLRKFEYRGVPTHRETHTSVRSLVWAWYGPSAGSFWTDSYEGESPDYERLWLDYVDSFYLLPCVKRFLPLGLIVPQDFPVRPLNDETPPGATYCGTCHRGWDDSISTAWTPAPSARCPFEYFHDDET